MFTRIATVVCLLTTSSLCWGQSSGVPSAPSGALNWLNLNRQGVNPAVNYYGIVRPNAQTQNSLQNIQQEYNNLSQSVTNPDTNNPNSIRGTGHSATFMSYGHYYPRLGGGNGSSTPARAGAPRR